MPGAIAIRVQRIAVAAQRADGESVIGQRLLERAERRAVVQHRQLAVRVSGIVAGAQLHRRDVMRRQLLQNVAERELRQQRGEYADLHLNSVIYLNSTIMARWLPLTSISV